MRRYRLGFDIGGTFTDFALSDRETGALRVHKTLTTPHDPSIGVMKGLRQLLLDAAISAADLKTVIHGTTLVANTLIERTGARVGLLTTLGFRDILEIRNEQRYDIYDLFIQFPAPLVPRYLRLGVNERVAHDGRVLTKPDAQQLEQLAGQLRTENVEALAISFLHAYRNPQNEQTVALYMADALPGIAISLSSEVAPEIREYERTSTTVANAYVQPRVQRYLERLEALLQEQGYAGRLYLILSSGGSASTRTAAQFPIRLVESGPAAGAIAAAHFGVRAARPNVLSFDMGGTTAKMCLIREGRSSLTRDIEVARLHRFRKGSGLPLQFPSMDMIEIGAGGGSIAHVDRMGLLKVGPASAGADPGPACYGLGGKEPTVTDANLLLGYLNPEYFLGGEMALDYAAAERAIQRVAGSLGLSALEAAWGIHSLVNENMASAAKIHVIERAEDPRRFALLAYGGGGPIHAAGVAHILAAPEVICPPAAGVASAIGLLIAPLSFELVLSYPVHWDQADSVQIEQILADLTRKGVEMLAEAGVDSELSVERSADGRFIGQLHELTVPFPARALEQKDIPRVQQAFVALYEERYGHLPPGVKLEFLTWRVTVSGPPPTLPSTPTTRHSDDIRTAQRGTRQAYFGKAGFLDTSVFDRYRLAAGMRTRGPAIVEERESTIVVPPGTGLRVDEYSNVILDEL